MSKTAEKIKQALQLTDESFYPDDYVVVKHGQQVLFPSYAEIGRIPDASPNQDSTVVILKRKDN